MKLRNVILVAAGLVILAVLIFLLLEAKGGSSAKLTEAELERERAKYKGSQRVEVEDKARKRPSRPRPTERPKRADADDPPKSDVKPNVARRPRPAVKNTFKNPMVSPMGGSDDDKKKMQEATRLYDKGDYPAAEKVAIEVLRVRPHSIKMLRVVVSTKCATGEEGAARKFFERLPQKDRKHMKKRCLKWGVEL